MQAQARADGISEAWLEAAKHSPVWKMAMDWKIAFPLHPEYRTLPMVWYVPPLSPIQAAAAKGDLGEIGGMPDVKSLRIPVRISRQPADRRSHPAGEACAANGCWRCAPTCESKTVDGVINDGIAERVGLSGNDIEDMYQLMAIANYEDRFVIPTAHRETGEDAYQLRGSCGFSFGEGCAAARPASTCSRATRPRATKTRGGRVMARTYRALAALLSYPTEALQAATGEIAAALAEEAIVAAPQPRGHRCAPGRDRRHRHL